MRLVGADGPGLPRSMTISGGPDDPPSPVHPGDIFRSASFRVGAYHVSIAYGESDVPTFRLPRVNLTAAAEVARVFYSVGGVHEDFNWDEV